MLTATPMPPLLALEPAGAFIYQTLAQGEISSPTETDSYSLPLDASQRLTIVAEALSDAPRPRISAFDPSNALIESVDAAVGENAAVLQSIFSTTAGTYRFDVEFLTGSGDYELTVLLGAAQELEAVGGPTNDSIPTAQDIESSSVRLTHSSDRMAVAGTLASSSPDLIRFHLDAGQSIDMALSAESPLALFSDRRNLDVGINPFGVALGDMNGDGRLDIVTVEGGEFPIRGTVSVSLNTGGAFAAAQTTVAGHGPTEVVLGHLDADAHLDAAMTSIGSNAVTILLGAGDGTFLAPAIDVPAGDEPTHLAMGDVNEDGAEDLVVVNPSVSSAAVSLLLGNGDGTFEPRIGITVGARPRAVALADLNGDEHLDLVAAIEGATLGEVVVLLGAGNGAFTAPATFFVGRVPIDVAVGDVNQDGFLDVVTANSGLPGGYTGNNSTVTVLMGDGAGSLTGRSDYRVGLAPVDVALGDIDQDGDFDIVTSLVGRYGSGELVGVLLGRGDGRFVVDSAAERYSLVGRGPTSLALGDLDDDGDFDAVTVSPNFGANAATVLLGTTPLELELLDASGATVAVGRASASNSLRAIESFIAPSSGEYYAHVASATALNYTLVVTRGASFEAEQGGTSATADDLPESGVVLGSLRGGAEPPLMSTLESEPNGTPETANDIRGALARIGIRSFSAAIIGSASSIFDTEVFRFAAGPGDALSLQFATPFSGRASMGVVNRHGVSLAGVNSGGFASLDYTFPAGAYSGDYFIFAHPLNGSYTLLVTQTTENGQLVPDGDAFLLAAVEGARLTVTVLAPDGGPDQPVNPLGPVVELVNPSGIVVATSANGGADERNARLTYEVPPGGAGTYRVHVAGTAAQPSGDYVLVVGDGHHSSLVALTTDPSDGNRLPGLPATFRVDFSQAIDTATIEAADFRVRDPSGVSVAATGFTIVNHSTVEFDVVAANLDGNYAVSIAAGTIQAVGGAALEAFSAAFTLDRIHPTVTDSSIHANDVLPVGGVALRLELSEPLSRVGLGAEDLVLAEQLLGEGTFAPATFRYDEADRAIDVAYANLPAGQYRLTLKSGVDAVRDLAGLGLDGTGVGTNAADFTLDFTIDATTSPYSSPLLPIVPVGSLAAEGSLPGQIHAVGDVDRFTLALSANDRLSVFAAPDNASVRTIVRILGPANELLDEHAAEATGEIATLTLIPSVGAGIYTVEVEGLAGAGRYDLNVVLNAQHELETSLATNGTLLTAEGIGGSAVDLGGNGQRLAVMGQLGPGDDVFRFDAIAGQYLSLAVASHAGDSGQFGGGRSIDVGVSAELIQSADLDADALAELIVAAPNENRVLVLRANTLGAAATLDAHAFDGRPTSLALGDIDADGDLDLVTAADIGVYTPGYGLSYKIGVQVLLGRGDATFEPSIQPSALVEGNDARIALADMDGQHGLDLVIASLNGQVLSIVLQQADGSFATPTDYATVGRIQEIATGDVDADGDADVLLTANGVSYSSTSGGTVEVLLGHGNGTLVDSVSYPLLHRPIALVVGDFDADGDDDVAVAGLIQHNNYYSANPSERSLNVLIARGDGELANPVVYPVAHQPRDLVAGDLDGDGDIDLAIANDSDYDTYGSDRALRSLVSVFLGRGDGAFASPTDALLPAQPGPAALGDLDGDGDLDLALAPAQYAGDTNLTVMHGTGGIAIELLDASGEVVALGSQTSGRTQNEIADFRVTDTGAHYARIRGTGASEYTLIVNANVAWEEEPANDRLAGQNISTTGLALGHLTTVREVGHGPSGAIRVAVQGVDEEVVDEMQSAATLDAAVQFDFDVQVVRTSDMDTLAELSRFDVLVLGEGFWRDGVAAQIAPAVRAWVEAGGGLVALPDVSYYLDDQEQGTADLDAVVPVNVAANDPGFITPRITFVQTDHPVTAGLSDYEYNQHVSYPSDSMLDEGAMILATGAGGRPLIVAGTAGAGRSVWFGIPLAAYNFDSDSTARLLRQAAAYVAGEGVDQYAFAVFGGENLLISTAAQDIAGQTPLDARIEVYNELGLLVGSDDNSGVNGRDALVAVKVPVGTAGQYRVVVHPVSGSGDYALWVDGMQSSPGAPPRIVATQPAEAAHLAVPPLALNLVFSTAIRPNSLDVADLTIDGEASVASARLIDGRTIQFRLNVPDVAGTYHYSLADGGVVDLQGQPMTGHAGTFEIDHTGPRIVDQHPAVQAAAPFRSLTFTFDEPLGAVAFNRSIVESFTNPNGFNILGIVQRVTGSGAELTVEFSAMSQPGAYRIVLDAARIVDEAGNFLDQNADGAPGMPDDDYAATVTIQSMDLTVNAFTPAATSAVLGGPLGLSWTIKNIGGDPALEGWTDRAWLSTDSTLDRNADLSLNEFSAADVLPLAAQATYDRAVEVTLPLTAALSSGTYYLFLETDAGRTQAELLETNNVRFATIDLTLPPLPDLFVDEVSAPIASLSDREVDVTWTVINPGNAPATGTWTDYIYLSHDAIAGNDQFVGAFTFTGTIAPNGSLTRTRSIHIPFNLTGDRYVVVQTDATNMVFEHAREHDNVGVDDRPIAVELTPFPNLIARMVRTSSVDVELNQPFVVSWTVDNTGTGATSGPFWSDEVYLSTNQTLDSGDLRIGVAGSPRNLPAGDAYDLSANVRALGVALGEYYLLVKADGSGQVNEFTAEGDNVSVGPRLRVVAPSSFADLIVSSIYAPATAFSNETIEVTWMVTNEGNASASGNWTDRIWLSGDTAIGNDQPYGEFAFNGGVGPGETVTRTQTIALPHNLSGSWRVVVATDTGNDVFEYAQDADNAILDDRPILVSLAPFPNLIAQMVQTSAAEVDLGQPFPVNWIVQNVGSGATSVSFWSDYVYLSVDQSLDATDVRVGVAGNPSYLIAGDSYGNHAVATAVGVSEGDYYLLVKADGADRVNEFTGEGNNVAVGPRVRVHVPQPPDLIVTNVDVQPLALSGQPTIVTYRVENVGAETIAAGFWFDDVYLSENSLLDGTDTRIGRLNRSLADSTQPDGKVAYDATVQVTLPIGIAGTFHLLVVVDGTNNINEFAFDQNNVGHDATMVLLTPPPDLVVEELQTAPTVLAGQLLTISYTVANRGATDVPNSNWSDSLYLSFDSQLDPETDILLRNVNIFEPELAVDLSYERSVVATLPNGLAGDYYLILRADRNDVVFELDDTNNVLATTTPISVSLAPPDLRVTAITADSEINAGGGIRVVWTVLNQGAGETLTASWQDRVYLSRDAEIGNADDRILAARPRFGRLASGGAYDADLIAPMPFDVSGVVYVYARTDDLAEGSHGVVEEFAAETNNASTLVAVQVNRRTSDLSGEALRVLPEAGQLRIDWRVTNLTENQTSSDYWTDAVVLSSNAVHGDADDLLLATRQHTGRLTSPQSYVGSLLAAVPYHVTGTRHVFVVTDYNDQVDEGDVEANNVSLAGVIDIDALRTHYDLLPASVDAPAEATSGQYFSMSWTVRNVGSRLRTVGSRSIEAAGGSWNDVVYLSRDQLFDPSSDIFLGQIGAGASSLVEVIVDGESAEEYSRTTNFYLPIGLSGPFYVFLATNRGGAIVELGADENNVAYDPLALIASLAPPADLVVGRIDVPASAALGANVDLTYTLTNAGDHDAAGSWFDRLYLSTDNQFSPDDVRLALRQQRGFGIDPDPPVTAGGSATFDVHTTLPPILPGQYYLVLRTDAFNAVSESDETNNLGASLDRVSIDIPAIEFAGGSATATIETDIPINQTRSLYYRFDATEGQTISLTALYIDLPDMLIADPTAPGGFRNVPVPRRTHTMAYVAFGRVPTPIDHDFSQADFLTTFDHAHSGETLVIPRTRAGAYFIRLDLRDRHSFADATLLDSHERFDLVATVLPFTITAVESAAPVGNTGPATVEVTASNFNPCTQVDLLQDGQVIRPAQQMTHLSPDKSLVTFDLADLSPRNYAIRVTDFNGTSDTAPLTVVAGTGARVGASIRGQSPVRTRSEYEFYANYGNSGDADGIAPLLLIESTTTDPWGLSRDQMRTQPTLQALGISLDGPAGVLRPGELGSVPVFFRTGDFTPPRFALHTITADDPRPLVFSEIENQIRPADITDEQWNALRPLLMAKLGQTWGNYVLALARTATTLAMRGTRTSDVSVLFQQLIAELIDPNPVVLNGIVIAHENCAPLARPLVQALDASGVVVAIASSLDTGEYSFAGLPPGTYTLVADAAGRARTVVPVAVPGLRDFNIALPLESRITGRVQPGPGSLVDGAVSVQATRQGIDSPVATFTVQQTALEFTLGGLSAGTYQVVVDFTGSEPATRMVIVGDAETVDLGEIPIPAGGFIIGKVVAPDGSTNVQHAIVNLFRDNALVRSSLLTGEGDFSFSLLPASQYMLRAQSISGGDFISPDVSLNLSAGQTVEDLELLLSDGRTLTGVVTDSVTSTAWAELPVALRTPDGAARIAFTNELGQYRFDHLTTGQYRVGLAVGGRDGFTEVAIDATDGSSLVQDLQFASVAMLAGHVTRRDGSPIEGVTVRLGQNSKWILGTKTDSDGRYTFRLLEPGVFDVHPALDGASFAPETGLTVNPGESVNRHFVAGAAELVVSPQPGRQLPTNALVLLRQLDIVDQPIVGSAIVGVEGTVRFSQAVGGNYLVEIRAPNNLGGRATTTLLEAQSHILTLDIEPQLTLAGRVDSTFGTPIPGAAILLASTNDPGRVMRTVSIQDGSFELTGLDSGVYSFVVSAPGFQTAATPVVLPTNSHRQVSLTAATSSVSGRVVDTDGRPMPLATVSAADKQGFVLAESGIASDGTFYLPGVSGDDLKVIVTALGHREYVLVGLDVAESATVDIGDIPMRAIAIGQGTGNPSPPPSPLAGASVAGAPTPAPSLAFLLPNIAQVASIIYTQANDIPRSPNHIASIDPLPCVACNAEYQVAVTKVNGQDSAYAMLESWDDQLDVQVLLVPTLILGESMHNAGTAAQIVLAIGSMGLSTSLTTSLNSWSTVAGAATSSFATLGYSIAQSIAAIYSLVTDTVDALLSTTWDQVVEKWLALTNSVPNVIQLLTFVVELGLPVAQLAAPGSYVPVIANIANNYIGGLFNLVGTLLNIKALANTLSYSATRQQLSLLKTKIEQRDAVANAYNLAVQIAHLARQHYYTCVLYQQENFNACPDALNLIPPAPIPPLPPPDSPPLPPGPPTPPTPTPPPSVYPPEWAFSLDPNDILGPLGFGNEQWVSFAEPLTYRIRFENQATATAPAQRVTITQQLDDDFDFRTFRVDDFGWSERNVELAADKPFHQARLDIADGSGLVLDMIATVDILTGMLTWIFQTIDLMTGEAPRDALAGFLPPNDATGRGEGFVSYTVRPKRTALTGARLDAEATIVFDDNEPIDTPAIFNTLDAAAPTSSVEALMSATDEETFTVRWSADDADGSAVATFDLYVSRDAQPYEPWLVGTTLRDAPYAGVAGHTYSFYAVAQDNAGNTERVPTTPDTETSIPFPGLFGDMNHDVVVGLLDLVRLQNHLGQLSGATHDDGDLTGDRAVTRQDLARFLQHFGRSEPLPGASAAPAAIDAVLAANDPEHQPRLIASRRRAGENTGPVRRRLTSESQATEHAAAVDRALMHAEPGHDTSLTARPRRTSSRESRR